MTDSAGPPPRPEDAAAGRTAPPAARQPPPAQAPAAPASPTPPAATPPGLSKDDYAHTTGTSPSSTAVFPPVKDSSTTYGWRRPDSDAASTLGAALSPASTAGPGASRALRSPTASTHATTVNLVHIDPWSVTRHAFAISVALMVVAVVAAAVLWIMLAMSGVWTSINDSLGSVLADGSETFDITDYLGFGRMIGAAVVLSAINVVFMTALATIGAQLYNLVAAMSGGVEVTLTED